MAVELSSRLAKSDAMSGLVHKYEDFVESELPRTANALWDLSQDYEHRARLTLALSDPFGYAVTHFALDEIDSREEVQSRVHDLVDELLRSVRRERIEIRDTFASVEQIRGLQLALNAIPMIAAASSFCPDNEMPNSPSGT